MKAGLKLKMMNIHDAQPYQKPLTITEKLKKLSEKISIQLIAERMSIDKKTMWQVLHENLHMTKVCAQVVSKLLTSDQKEKRQEVCADISKQIEENPKFLDSVPTVPAMRDEFSSTNQRQRDSPCIGKLLTHHELKKQNKAKSKFQNQNSRQC